MKHCPNCHHQNSADAPVCQCGYEFARSDIQVKPVNEPFTRFYKTWWLTLIGAYLLSFLWLGPFAVCVPIVIRQAPLGFTSLFHPPINPSESRIQLGNAEIGLHLIFWSLFIVGAFGCKVLPKWILRAIYTTIIVMLLLTFKGCSQYYHIPKF